MVRTLIFICMLFAPALIATSASGGWVGDWWSNVYEQRVEKEQYRQIQKQEIDRCGYKLRWYEEKLANDPKSEYYQYKREYWNKKCTER